MIDVCDCDIDLSLSFVKQSFNRNDDLDNMIS